MNKIGLVATILLIAFVMLFTSLRIDIERRKLIDASELERIFE